MSNPYRHPSAGADTTPLTRWQRVRAWWFRVMSPLRDDDRHRVLRLLRVHGPATLLGIHDALGGLFAEYPTITATVRELEDEGLIEQKRADTPQDALMDRCLFDITERGELDLHLWDEPESRNP